MTHKIKLLYQQLLQQYSITAAESKLLQKKIALFIRELRNELHKNNIKATVMLGGSAAKATYIKDDFDCDIFVRFNYQKYSAEEQKIAALLGKVLKKYNPAVIHGSRDYYHVIRDNIRYEIVPVLQVKDPKKAVNVTDMSPLHVKWVIRHMTKKIRDEIILTKLFLKANQLYGAESYIKGFSGHVIDILLVYYGSFLKLLRASLHWKEFEVIDVEKHNTAKWLNESKLAPVIVIDPVQPTRNAAAALSLEKFQLFQQLAKKFLENPSKEFFVKNIVFPLELQQQLREKYRKQAIFILELFPLAGKEDVVLTKLLKAFEYIEQQAAEYDIILIASGINFNNKKKVLAYFVVPNTMLDKQKIIKGPTLEFINGCREFQKKHATAFLQGKRWYAYEQRKFVTFEQFLKSILTSEYVIQRVRKTAVLF